MSWTLVISVVGFAFVASITPGPNNIMLLASGANFGLRRTLPHLLGIVVGFGLMVAMMGLGMANLIRVFPQVFDIVRWLGAAYLLVLALKIATAKGIGGGSGTSQPMTVLEAALFQLVNPKAWAIAIGAFAAFVDHDHAALNVALVIVLFPIVNAPCVATWAVAGVGIKRLLSRPLALRTFNVTMGTLLVLSLYPMLRR